MAITSFAVPGTLTGDTEFRNWGQAISNALAAMGLVKTSDTGQINFTTVAKPTGATTVAGYEIWRFNDALQATTPVFIKLEYGTGNVATAHGMWITIGSSTDGAGNLTGVQISTRKQSGANAGFAGATVYMSGATDRISWVTVFSTAQNGYGFHIERSKDASGNNTSAGVCTYHTCSYSSYSNQEQFVPAAGPVPTQEGQPYAFAAPSTTAVSGTDVGLFPHFIFHGKLLNPRMGVITYMTADIQQFIQISVNMYGAAHNYLTLGNNTHTSSTGLYPGRGLGTNVSIMMRYE
jgi:hypothetical protein